MASGDPIYPASGTAGDGVAYYYNSDYATARAGGGSNRSSDNAGTEYRVGQAKISSNYYCFEVFQRFDTSAIPDDAIITAATLYAYFMMDGSTTDFVIEARAHSGWGTSIGTEDFVPGASLSELTLLASYSTASGVPTNAYTQFSSEDAFLSAINRSGNTDIIISSSRQRGGNQPSGDESVYIWSAEENSAAETRPRLVVTWSAASSASYLPGIMRHYFIPELGGH